MSAGRQVPRAGPVHRPRADRHNPHLLTKKQLEIRGSWAFAADHYRRYVATLPQLTQRFDLTRLVTQYPLEDVNGALADMRSGVTLKPVLSPAL